jgi:HTH-type transcriptional regulator/antitoxin HigA
MMNAVPGSMEAGELELLALLVEIYDQEHYPLNRPDSEEAIRFRLSLEAPA